MDVEICAADAAGFDFDEDIVVSEFGEVDFDDAVVLRLGIPVKKRRKLAVLDDILRVGRFWGFQGILRRITIPDLCVVLSDSKWGEMIDWETNRRAFILDGRSDMIARLSCYS